MGGSQSTPGRLGSSMDVFLLPRDVLFRDFPGCCLPHFQDIKEYLKVRTVTFLDVLNQNLDDVLVVSHRWESSGNPDVTGDQLQAMRSFLLENERFKFVWFDFSCLPQRTRNLLEEEYFKIALKNVNLLYLHAHVLVLYDRDYNRRFWCLYETFLGCRMFDGTTLVGGSEHLDVRCVGSLSELSAENQRSVAKCLLDSVDFSVKSFSKMMLRDDIAVTNESDKHNQLKKLESLSSLLQQLHEEKNALPSSPAESAQSAEKSVLEALVDTLQNVDKIALAEGAIVKLRNINPAAAQELSRVLQENCAELKFHWIPLWRNYNIGDAGAAALAEAILVNGAITTLDLGANSIGDAGATALAEAIRANRTITHLDLTWNNIRDDGARALADALKVNGAITTLDLEHNSIGDAGATALAEAIRENDSLKILAVGSNNFGWIGRRALNKAREVRKSRGKKVTIWTL